MSEETPFGLPDDMRLRPVSRVVGIGNLLSPACKTDMDEIFPDTPKVLLYHGANRIDAAIRWQTDGCVAHAALWFPPSSTIPMEPYGSIYEAVLSGVRHRTAVRSDFAGDNAAEIYDVLQVNRAGWLMALDFLDHQLGKPYDVLGPARFLTRMRRPRDTCPPSWFCSELIFAAVRRGGVELLHCCAGSRLTRYHQRRCGVRRC
jgi:hypothetical protein